MRTLRIIHRALLHCCPLGLSLACQAGDGPPGPPPRGPQLMLYFRQPLGAAGAHRIYGLRIDQASAAASAGAPGAAPLRRREILNLEIGQHANMRVELARHLVWDVGSGRLNLGPMPASAPFRLPAQPAALASPAHAH